MKNNVKECWKKPELVSVEEGAVKKNIIAFACSQYSDGCFPAGVHLDTIPGFPSWEIM
ncbi:MAG: hypothetical protein IJ325_10050 [Clostridia bacterium]|nr:hypothetical protein [Clostridia bacterium]